MRDFLDRLQVLTRSNLPVAEFFMELLTGTTKLMQSFGGATWQAGQPLHEKIIAQVGELGSGHYASPDDLRRHQFLIYDVFQSGEARVVPPRSQCSRPSLNPSESLLLVVPVQRGEQVPYVVEIFQRPTPSVRTRRGYMMFVTKLCVYATQFLERQRCDDK